MCVNLGQIEKLKSPKGRKENMNNKKSLANIPAGHYFVTVSIYGCATYLRGDTRWASYRLDGEGIPAGRSTRHDARQTFAAFEEKEDARRFCIEQNAVQKTLRDAK